MYDGVVVVDDVVDVNVCVVTDHADVVSDDVVYHADIAVGVAVVNYVVISVLMSLVFTMVL